MASPEHRQLAIINLQSAAMLEVKPAVAAPGGNLELQLIVTNRGAGHYLPTGLTEVREMWLDVEVKDADGKSVYHSGGLDDNGAVDPHAVMYQTVFRDKDGQPTHKPWLAASMLTDHRVPPQGSITENYSVPVPVGSAAPLTVQATLRYRSAPQTLLDDLLGKGALTAPVIDMATASVNIG